MSGEETESLDMDRKPGRAPSSQPKGYGDNAKKENQTSKNGKGGYRREGGGSKQRDQGNKKPYHQKPRPADRRPRPRENYSNRQGEEVTERGDGTYLKHGNKKTNLNHLLNFSVTSRDTENSSEYRDVYVSQRQGSRYNKRYNRKNTVKFNKEQFLQANCQFVVKEGDYSVHLADPDILVDWENIEQIRIYSNEVPSCPICLYPPVAAKMTRCGHTYCWRCMLHYLSLSEKKTWRKCPICYEAVHQKDLKSVCALETHQYKPGEEITMRLMKRERGSTFVMPVEQWHDNHSQPVSVTDGPEIAFAKLVVASSDDVQSRIIDTELTALQTQLADDGESLEGSYVKAALELLKERQVNLNMAKAAKDCVHEKPGIFERRTSPTAQVCGNSFAPLGKGAVEYSSAFSDEEIAAQSKEEKELPTSPITVSASAPNLQSINRTVSESSNDSTHSHDVTADEETASGKEPESTLPSNDDTLPSNDETLPSNTMSITTADGEKVEVSIEEAAEELALPVVSPEVAHASGGKRTNEYYFYQASDGQQIYLNSLNARCLVREYGSLDKCPPTITAKIVEMEGISMNEELRGRLKYLNHLPLTCEFKVAELLLKPPMLSKDTLSYFAEDIERRRRNRHRKQRDERRQLRSMQNKMYRKYENCPEMRVLIDSQHFPETQSTIVQSDMHSVVQADGDLGSDLWTPVGSPASEELATSPRDDGCQSSMSFAQMLRAGKKQATKQAWPSLAGTSSTASVQSGTARGAGASDESDSEDRVPVPLFKDSFGDALKKALDQHDKNPGTPIAVETSIQQMDSANSGKKKKKKTKTLLFTTTMARSK